MDILRQVFIDSFTLGTQNVSKVKQLSGWINITFSCFQSFMNFFNSYCFAVSHISYQWLHSDTLYHILLNGCILQKKRMVHTRLNSFASITATFNNILVRSCSSVLLLDETRVHAVNHIQTLLHNREHPTTCFITLLYLLVVLIDVYVNPSTI